MAQTGELRKLFGDEDVAKRKQDPLEKKPAGQTVRASGTNSTTNETLRRNHSATNRTLRRDQTLEAALTSLLSAVEVFLICQKSLFPSGLFSAQ
jgi:hypothetical protein